MMNQFKNLSEQALHRLIELTPEAIVQRIAKPYIAGSDRLDAIDRVRRLYMEGAESTIDVLGEAIQSEDEADATVEEYLALIRDFENASDETLVRVVTLSVKLSALGLDIDVARSRDRLLQIAEAAGDKMLIRLDMEDHHYTDRTLDMYEACCELGINIGIVLQAMLFRTRSDIERLSVGNANVRLCKGIYREPADLAIQDDRGVQEAYLGYLESLLSRGDFVGIATHDDVLISGAKKLIAQYKVPVDRYEFQMLLGVRPKLRRQLLAEGHRLRVYVPYGKDWYKYSVRRLKENPTVAKHIMRATVLRR